MATAVILGGGEWMRHGVHRKRWEWTTTATGFSDNLSAAHLPNKTVLFFGPSGGQTNVLLEGAIYASGPFTTLTSASGASLTFTDASPGVLYKVHENPAFIRARASTVTTGATGLPIVEIISSHYAG